MKIEAGKWYETRGGDVVQAYKYEDADERDYPYFYVRNGCEFNVTEDGFYHVVGMKYGYDLIKEFAAPETKQEEKQEVKFVPTHVDKRDGMLLRVIGCSSVSNRQVCESKLGSLFSVSPADLAPYTPPHELDGLPVGTAIFVRDTVDGRWNVRPFIKIMPNGKVKTFLNFSSVADCDSYTWDEYRLTNPMMEGKE